MKQILNKFKLLRSLWIIGLITLGFSQDEEERTPLWIEKEDIIISIKPNALMSLKSSDANDEKIIKYFDVDHKKREIYYKIDGRSDILSYSFDSVEYFKPLKKGVPYAVKVVALSGVFGAGLGYYDIASSNPKESDSEKIFQAAFTSAIISGFIGSYLFSEKRTYISSFVYIEEDGETVQKFPELIRMGKNEWKIIE
tara:strand:- start:23393 stop:23983 length:591 start_codon:yes stop_codon:yes gene_type:complete